MPWSTSEIAEIAGTTVKAVRHYHAIGLLDEPERATNGYKQYGVAHLIGLLRITRLTELDVPLAQIAAMRRSEAEPDEALRQLDSEIAASIERLTQVRVELASILDHESSVDLPTGFGQEADRLPEADRTLILIYSKLYSAADMQDIRQLLIAFRDDPADAEFAELAADSDDATRQRLAEHYVPHMRGIAERFPWMVESRYPRSARAETGRPRLSARQARTLGGAVGGLYNEAQVDVMRRLGELLLEEPSP